MANIRPAAVLCAVSLLLLAACSGGDSEPPAEDTVAPEVATDAAATVAEPAGMPRTQSAEGARVFFITPQDGATVTSPVTIEFGLERMDVVPAGVDEPNSGHHHLLVDTELPPLDQPIPADPYHIHFGDGSTSTELELEPGEHTLLLLLGDHLHVPHDPPITSPTITITVE